MRLVEFFELLEAKDRLEHLTDRYSGKILKRWRDKVNDGGMTGLPDDWKTALGRTVIPDGMTLERFKDDKDIAERFPQFTEWVVNWFAKFDPSKNNKFTDWMLRQWLVGAIYLEDVYKLTDYLDTFDRHKKNLEKKDINQYKTYQELARTVRSLVGTEASGQKVKNFLAKDDIQQMMNWPVPDPVSAFGEEGAFDIDELRSAHAGWTGGDGGEFDTHDWYDTFGQYQDIDEQDVKVVNEIEPIYKSDRLAVLQPNTRRAACELGRGSEWCTAATSSNNYFWNYATEGPLYVILTDKMGKFQFHFETGQFADVHDEILKDEQKEELVNAYPELKEIFFNQAIEHAQLWLVDPERIDKDFIEWLIPNAKRHAYTGDADYLGMMKKIPKAFDGKVDEEVLQMVEAWLRENEPIDAWFYVRKPTDADFQASMNSDSRDVRHVDMSHRILIHADHYNIPLSDETYEMAIARGGDNIFEVPLERIQQNPQWALAAVQDQPRIIEEIFAADSHIDTPRKEQLQNILLNYPGGEKAITNALYHDPSLVSYIGAAMGIEPWKAAFQLARKQQPAHGVQGIHHVLAPHLRKHSFEDKEVLDLFYYVLRSKLLPAGPTDDRETNRGTVLAQTIRNFESGMSDGKFPLEVQKELLQANPMYVLWLDRPNADIDKLAKQIIQSESEPSAPRTMAKQRSTPPGRRQ